MIYIGLIIASTTELLERFISVGSFYLSPARMYIVGIAWLALLGACASRHRITFGSSFRAYLYAVLALLAFTALSVTTSTDKVYSIKRVLNSTSIYLMPLVVYFYQAVFRSGHSPSELVQRSAKTVVFCGILVSVFGFIQAGTGWLQTTGEVRSIFGLPVPRINSLFADKNFLSYFLVIPIWIIVAGDRSVHGIKGNKRLWLAVLTMVTALLMTTSRGGILMLFGCAYCAGVERLFRNRRGWIAALEIPVIVLLPLTMLGISYFGFEHVLLSTSKLDTSTDSGASRIFAWYSGLRLYGQQPWLGVGPGNFVTMDKGSYLPVNYVAPWVAEKISVLAGHSNVLETLVESGPFALAAYFSIQLTVYRALLFTPSGPSLSASVFRQVFVGLAVGNLFLSYYSIVVMILVGVVLYSHDRLDSDVRSFSE